jgi:hypothetical protein
VNALEVKTKEKAIGFIPFALIVWAGILGQTYGGWMGSITLGGWTLVAFFAYRKWIPASIWMHGVAILFWFLTMWLALRHIPALFGEFAKPIV